MFSRLYIRLFLFVLFLIFSFNCLLAQDSLAVVELYKSTYGDDWVNNENWLSENPLAEWYGITVENSEVIAIELPLNHLSGELPLELGKLSSLVTLDISQNNLTGTLSELIGQLSSLNYLNISQNRFSGEIFNIIINLRKLKYLDISQNNFFGEIPRAIGRLKELELLDISNNSFNNELPNELFKLHKLSKLDLHGNYFRGPLPRHIGNLIQLSYLDLSKNKLSGILPKEIGKLINLSEKLALNHNEFIGAIPNEICSLSKLENLWLNNNKLEGILPFDIGRLVGIRSLFIYQNELVGPLPKSIGNLRNLEILYIQNNSFAGTIPNELWFLPELKMLKMENNNFTGSIPGNLHILKSIQSIDLSNNFFEAITDTLALPNSMLSYDLSNNRLYCDSISDSLRKDLQSQSQGKLFGLFNQNCSEVSKNTWLVEPSTIDFENVSTDTSLNREMSVINISEHPIQISFNNYNVDNFIVPDTLLDIAENDTIIVGITFTPTDDELHSDVIFLSDTVSGQSSFVTVTGQGYESDLPERDKTVPWTFKLHPIAQSDSTEAIINYDIPRQGNTNITIYNLGGRPVKNLIDGEEDIGYKEIGWDYKNDQGEIVDIGEYLVVMQAGMFIQIQPLLIIY